MENNRSSNTYYKCLRVPQKVCSTVHIHKFQHSAVLRLHEDLIFYCKIERKREIVKIKAKASHVGNISETPYECTKILCDVKYPKLLMPYKYDSDILKLYVTAFFLQCKIKKRKQSKRVEISSLVSKVLIDRS